MLVKLLHYFFWNIAREMLRELREVFLANEIPGDVQPFVLVAGIKKQLSIGVK